MNNPNIFKWARNTEENSKKVEESIRRFSEWAKSPEGKEAIKRANEAYAEKKRQKNETKHK